MKLIANFDKPITPNSIPFDHQYMVYSGVLNALSGVDSSLSDKLHKEPGPGRFVMSQLLGSGNKTFDKNGVIADRFVLLLASREPDVLKKILEGLENAGRLVAGKLLLPFHSGRINKIVAPPTTPELVTRSPIALKENGRFIRPDDDNFNSAIKNHMIKKYEAISGKSDGEIRIFRTIQTKNKLCRVGSAKIPCTFMKFVIDGNSELIRTMLTDGIGSKTQLGFGFIEVV